MTSQTSSKLDYAAGSLIAARQPSRVAGSALIFCAISLVFVVLTQPLIHAADDQSNRSIFFLRLLLGAGNIVMLLFAATWIAEARLWLAIRYGGLMFLVFLIMWTVFHFLRADFNNAWSGFR